MRPTVLPTVFLLLQEEASALVADVLGGVHVPVVPCAALRAHPLAHAQILGALVSVAAVGAQLAGRIPSADLHQAGLALLCEFAVEHVPQHAEPVVHGAFAEGKRPRHGAHVQVLNAYTIMGFRDAVRGLAQEVPTHVADTLVHLGDPAFLLGPIGRACDHMAQLALLESEPFLPLPVETRVVSTLPVAGHVQVVRRIVQSDESARPYGFGCLGIVLEQDGGLVPAGWAMLDGDAFEFPIVGDVLVLADSNRSHLG